MGTALRIRLLVKYDPAGGVPKIAGVRLNAKQICPGELPAPPTPAPIAKGLVSPCPNVFSYQSIDKQAGKWYGMIVLNPKYALTDPTLTILLDRPSLQIGVSYFLNYVLLQLLLNINIC